MNFVINIDTKQWNHLRTVSVEIDGQYPVDDADLVYVEKRTDYDTSDEFVCLIYRVPK